MKALPENTWQVTLIHPQDGTGDCIVILPDELTKLMGVVIGDELSVEVLNNQVKFTKPDNQASV